MFAGSQKYTAEVRTDFRLRRAFHMTLELFAEASLKKLVYAVSMVTNCVTRV